MCFSPAASFGAGIVLAAIGVVAIKKSQTVPQRFLACIPLIFAAQQCVEGVLWLALMHAQYAQWEKPATYAFLIFAQVIWPCCVPLSMLLLEQEPKRKKILSGLLATGVLLGLYLAYCLIHYPVQAGIDGHHIMYRLNFPGATKWYNGIFYFIPTVIPPFVSGIKRIRWIGVTIILSYIVTQLFFRQYVISVWCYFAAIISLIILSVIMQLRKAD